MLAIKLVNAIKCLQKQQLLLRMLCANKQIKNSFHTTFVSHDLMEFFEDPKNWGESMIKSGRAWTADELRIKSNSDLHKLWYVLYKEKNMLLTMEEACKDASETFPSPERIDKVDESMDNIEKVVRERNKAYYEHEIGERETGEVKTVFRKDLFATLRWHLSSEHLIPYHMNTKWRRMFGPGFGKEFTEFNVKLREKKLARKKMTIFKQNLHCRQLLRRFPNVDIDYLQEKYPDVNVKHVKENLDELLKENKWKPFSRLIYDSFFGHRI